MVVGSLDRCLPGRRPDSNQCAAAPRHSPICISYAHPVPGVLTTPGCWVCEGTWQRTTLRRDWLMAVRGAGWGQLCGKVQACRGRVTMEGEKWGCPALGAQSGAQLPAWLSVSEQLGQGALPLCLGLTPPRNDPIPTTLGWLNGTCDGQPCDGSFDGCRPRGCKHGASRRPGPLALGIPLHCAGLSRDAEPPGHPPH